MRGCASGFRSLCLLLTCVAVTGSARGEFTTIAGWDRQLFPSYIVATATLRGQDEQAKSAGNPNLLGNGSGILGVRVRSPKDNAQIQVTISSDSILEPSTFCGTLASEGAEYRSSPNSSTSTPRWSRTSSRCR